MGEAARILDEQDERALPPKKKGERGPTVALLTKMKARNLYLSQGFSVPGVAKECGISLSVVRKWALVEGWASERRAAYSRLVAKQDAQRGETQAVIMDAIASECEEHALSALGNVRSALARSDRDAAKDSQAYSATVKNLASTARMLREPLSGSADPDGARVNLNFFFAPMPAAQNQEPKTVQPIEVKQVTE